MADLDVVEDLVTKLITDLSLVEDEDIFRAPMMDAPAGPSGFAVWVVEDGGPEAVPDMGTNQDDAYVNALIQVRSDINQREVARLFIQQVRRAIHKQEPPSYSYWFCSRPVLVDYKSNQRTLWSMTVRTLFKEDI